MASQVSLIPVLLEALTPMHVTQHIDVGVVGPGEVLNIELLLVAQGKVLVPDQVQEVVECGVVL